MDRRAFLATFVAVPAAAALPIRDLISPPLSPFEQVKRLMTLAMAQMRRQIDQAMFASSFYGIPEGVDVDSAPWQGLPRDTVYITHGPSAGGWLNADGTWTHWRAS
jgi:hypothetical protein